MKPIKSVLIFLTLLIAFIIGSGFFQYCTNPEKPKGKSSDEQANIKIKDSERKLSPTLCYLIHDSLYVNSIKGYSTAEKIYGDFNGDGVKEEAWLESDVPGCEHFNDSVHCIGYICFSDRTIPVIKIDWCPIGFPQNEGDLNGDGKDEIGILPGWFSSDCRGYNIYTLKINKWIEAIKPIPLAHNLRRSGLKIVEKDLKHTGFVIIRYSDMDANQSCCDSAPILIKSIKIK